MDEFDFTDIGNDTAEPHNFELPDDDHTIIDDETEVDRDYVAPQYTGESLLDPPALDIRFDIDHSSFIRVCSICGKTYNILKDFGKRECAYPFPIYINKRQYRSGVNSTMLVYLACDHFTPVIVGNTPHNQPYLFDEDSFRGVTQQRQVCNDPVPQYITQPFYTDLNDYKQKLILNEEDTVVDFKSAFLGAPTKAGQAQFTVDLYDKALYSNITSATLRFATSSTTNNEILEHLKSQFTYKHMTVKQYCGYLKKDVLERVAVYST